MRNIPSEEQSAQTTDELQQPKRPARQDSITAEPAQSEKSEAINPAAAETSGQAQTVPPDSVIPTQQRAGTVSSASEQAIIQEEKPMTKPKRLKRTYYLPPDVVQQIHHLWMTRIPDDPQTATASKNEIVIELLKAGPENLPSSR